MQQIECVIVPRARILYFHLNSKVIKTDGVIIAPDLNIGQHSGIAAGTLSQQEGLPETKRTNDLSGVDPTFTL